MHIVMRRVPVIIALGFLALLSGCSPEVGSEQWCSDMKEKSKADWSANETADFAKHCVLK